MLSYLTRRSRGANALRPEGSVRPSRDVICAERDGLAVLLDLRRDIYFSLDEVGTLVWHEIEQGRAADAAERVCEEYDAPREVAQRDVERFVGELLESGLAVRA